MSREISTPRGQLPAPLLNPAIAAQKFHLARFEPSADLGFFLQNHWIIHWDLRETGPYVQDILPFPCVNLVFERGQSVVSGVNRGKASREIEGLGCAVGIKFKPGGFYPFIQSSVSALTNRLVPAEEIFGSAVEAMENQILSTEEPEEQIGLAETFLRAQEPVRDDTVTVVAQLVEEIAADRELTRVEQLVSKFGGSERTLQRLFLRYVGVNPKWIIRLYRLQEAADSAIQGGAIDWADLAIQLGYFDQAHFSKDFKKVLGLSPTAYARLNRDDAAVRSPGKPSLDAPVSS